MAKHLFLALAISICGTGTHAFAQKPVVEPTSKVVLASEVKWGALNPARGTKGPSAANIWGDRTGTGASGILVKFVDGFSSPPHIHNVTYRGVVISGLVHNDHPDAKPMWMATGSYWTQPAGEVHITAAKGSNNLAYIEIQKGPYLVLPKEKAVNGPEKPVNVDATNIVWLDASDITWIKQPKDTTSPGPKVAFLWGKPQGDRASGALIKLPAGFNGKLHSNGTTFRAVVIEGRTKYHPQRKASIKTLEPTSFFGSTGKMSHHISCEGKEGCVIYVRSEGKFDVFQEHSK